MYTVLGQCPFDCGEYAVLDLNWIPYNEPPSVSHKYFFDMAHSHLCKLATAKYIMSRFDHTSYYQSNLAASHNAYPSGWQPPFQGPPPIPAGANINPQVWNTGQWMFNPAYQHRQPSQIPNQTAWMAGHQWSAHGQAVAQAQAQGQSHNPYKKPIRPPSAEYLSQKLVDNPLGLSDMTPRCVHVLCGMSWRLSVRNTGKNSMGLLPTARSPTPHGSGIQEDW